MNENYVKYLSPVSQMSTKNVINNTIIMIAMVMIMIDNNNNNNNNDNDHHHRNATTRFLFNINWIKSISCSETKHFHDITKLMTWPGHFNSSENKTFFRHRPCLITLSNCWQLASILMGALTGFSIHSSVHLPWQRTGRLFPDIVKWVSLKAAVLLK